MIITFHMTRISILLSEMCGPLFFVFRVSSVEAEWLRKGLLTCSWIAREND